MCATNQDMVVWHCVCVSQNKHSTLINKTNSNYNVSVFLYQKHENVCVCVCVCVCVTSCEVVNECAVTESQDYFGGKSISEEPYVCMKTVCFGLGKQ